MRRLFLFLALALASVMPQFEVRAQEVFELTVEEAVERGLGHDRGLAAVRAEARAAEADYRRARAARLPVVRALGSYRRMIGDIPEAEFSFPGLDTTFTLLPIPLNQVHTELSVEQPLFAGFRIRHRVRAARLQAEAASLLSEQEEADVAFAIRTAYWRLGQAIAARDALVGAQAVVDEHVRRVRVLVAEGAALQTDLLSATTRRSEVKLDFVEAENAVQVARLELNRLIGLPLNTPVEPVSVDAPDPPLDVDDLLRLAVEARPHLAAMAARVEALAAEVAVTRGEWLPEVAASGRVVYARPNPLFFLEQDEFRGHLELGLTARWTIFDGGRSAAGAHARARLEAAEERLAEAREVVEVEAMRRHLEVARAREALSVAAQYVAEADETFRVVRLRFEEGAALPADVLEAEQAVRAAHAWLAAARGDHAVARAALLNVIGEVW